MSMITVSTKRNRVYKRKFDHDQARARYKSGAEITALAREYGVTFTAVERVVRPEVAERMRRQTRINTMSGVCVDCGKTGVSKRRRTTGEIRCRECASALTRTSVREDTLYCYKCGEWKPDDGFYHDRKRVGRRGRGAPCKHCNTQERREHRCRNRPRPKNSSGEVWHKHRDLITPELPLLGS